MTPDFIISRPIRKDEHPVNYFWELLTQLKDNDYPSGVVRLDARQSGTWAFSSSAGLVWARNTPLPSFPRRGVTFVGHNLRSEDKWRKTLDEWGDWTNHTMPYWRKASRLVSKAGIPASRLFFTNAFVGLVRGKKSTGTFPGSTDPSFCKWCRDFLAEQVRVMEPCLVAAFGEDAQDALSEWNIPIRARLDLVHPSWPYYESVIDGQAELLRNAYVESGCRDFGT